MSQGLIRNCSITYMQGTQYSYIKNVWHISYMNGIYPRFLKADPATGKFNTRICDVLSTNTRTCDVPLTHPSWITEQRHRSFGKCYTIHPDENTRYFWTFYSMRPAYKVHVNLTLQAKWPYILVELTSRLNCTCIYTYCKLGIFLSKIIEP